MTRATYEELQDAAIGRISAAKAININVCAFLDMLSHSEGTEGIGDDGYNVIVGGKTFSNGYAQHPEPSIYLPRYAIYSSAAGRYQFIKKTWRSLAGTLHLADFSPISQDLGAIELIRGRGALDDVIAGRFELAVRKCAKEWASLPGAGYGQRENALTVIQGVYILDGGHLASADQLAQTYLHSGGIYA